MKKYIGLAVCMVMSLTGIGCAENAGSGEQLIDHSATSETEAHLKIENGGVYLVGAAEGVQVTLKHAPNLTLTMNEASAWMAKGNTLPDGITSKAIILKPEANALLFNVDQTVEIVEQIIVPLGAQP